jgi:Putative MetA-pathway of phenol degradation
MHYSPLGTFETCRRPHAHAGQGLVVKVKRTSLRAVRTSDIDPGCVKTCAHERRADCFLYCLVPTTVASPCRLGRLALLRQQASARRRRLLPAAGDQRLRGPASLGGFRSRIAGIGPQIGYIFPMGDKMQGYINVKGYKEFAAQNRAEGWNAWLTFAISPAVPESASAKPIVRKY